MIAENGLHPGWVRGSRAILAACLLLAGAGALAEAPDSRGFYVGGMAGATTFDDDGVFSGYRLDDSDVGFALFGGYKFFRYLAVEARLSDLGSYSVQDPFNGGRADFDAAAISAHVVGIIPFGTSGWELFGQLGIASLRLDADCCGDDDQAAGNAGLGVHYLF
jgi:hypothetical protein